MTLFPVERYSYSLLFYRYWLTIVILAFVSIYTHRKSDTLPVADSLKSRIPDKLPGDQNGHIVGKQLGGSGGNLNNLVAQRGLGSNQNPTSPWRRFENRVRDEIETDYRTHLRSFWRSSRMQDTVGKCE
jgi:DNA/RNA non-specific endonuclease